MLYECKCSTSLTPTIPVQPATTFDYQDAVFHIHHSQVPGQSCLAKTFNLTCSTDTRSYIATLQTGPRNTVPTLQDIPSPTQSPNWSETCITSSLLLATRIQQQPLFKQQVSTGSTTFKPCWILYISMLV